MDLFKIIITVLLVVVAIPAMDIAVTSIADKSKNIFSNFLVVFTIISAVICIWV